MEEFSNQPIDLNVITQIEQLKFCDLDDNYAVEVMLTTAFTLVTLFALVIAAVLLIPNFPFELPVLLVAALVCGAIFWLRYLSAKAKQYVVREHDLVFRKGLLWRKMIAVSFNRIQHIDLTSGPLERRLNLTSLKIYTAGGFSSDLVIPGLNKQTAQKLRDMIINQTNIALEPSDNE